MATKVPEVLDTPEPSTEVAAIDGNGVVAVRVAASMASLKVAERAMSGATPVAVCTGKVEVTVGGSGGTAPGPESSLNSTSGAPQADRQDNSRNEDAIGVAGRDPYRAQVEYEAAGNADDRRPRKKRGGRDEEPLSPALTHVGCWLKR